MKKVEAEPYRDIDFSLGKRGPLIEPEPGKTKISIRLDNRVLEHFRAQVHQAGGGNYQTLINDALVSQIQQDSMQPSNLAAESEDPSAFASKTNARLTRQRSRQ